MRILRWRAFVARRLYTIVLAEKQAGFAIRGEGKESETATDLIAMRLAGEFLSTLGFDRTIKQSAEKTLPARRAAIGRESENALQPFEMAVERQASGNFFQRETAALGAVREPDEGDGKVPGVKAILAGAAAPGPQLRGTNDIIRHAFAPRTGAIRRMAVGTNHQAPKLRN